LAAKANPFPRKERAEAKRYILDWFEIEVQLMDQAINAMNRF
jgi:hypothetical protein